MTMAIRGKSLDVRLKRKVRSAETNLFEWRPCICHLVARDGKYLLELQTVSQGEGGDGDDHGETLKIDIATQLVDVVATKNKTRCRLEYYAPGVTRRQEVLKQHLMASSAAQCQQWIANVQHFQEQLVYQKRLKVSLKRESEAAPVAPLSSFQASPSKHQKSTINDTRSSELAQSERESVQNLNLTNPSSTFPCGKPKGKALSCRRCDDPQPISELDYTVDSSSCSPADDLESSKQPVSVSSLSSVSTNLSPTAWRKKRNIQLASPYYSSSSDSDVSHSSHRCSPLSHCSRRDDADEKEQASCEDDEESVLAPRRQNDVERTEKHETSSRQSNRAVSCLSLRELSSTCVSLQTQQHLNDKHQSGRILGEGESSQAELHILQRVEAALRALELENAQVKTRERELQQEIQTLRDAARVTAAEHSHTEYEFRKTRREIDAWRRSAQKAETAAVQLEQQLSIAHEEKQLVVSEKLRLEHQNNELRTQVQRLDALVYGRF